MKELLPLGQIEGLRALVADLGGDFGAIVAAISPHDSLDGDAGRYVSHRTLIEITNFAARKLGRADLGLIWGRRANPLVLGPLGVAMLNAPTARRALELFALHFGKQNAVLRGSLVPTPEAGFELFALVNTMKRPPSLVQVKERNIGIMLGILRTLLGDRFKPAEIWLSHPQNVAIEDYQRAYGMIPQFQKPVCGCVLKRADLDRRAGGHRREVFDMAVAFLGKAAALPDPDTDPVATAAAVLAINMDYSVSQVSAVMGVHVRGLQRQLNAAGVTFSMLKDNARREVAERLLLDGRRQLIEIALELGFKDQAAFTRASRRWFGLSPSAARIRLRELFEQDAAKSPRTNTLAVARRLRSRPEGV